MSRDADAPGDLFDVPSWWRAQAAMAMGFSDDLLIGAVSPAAGCPAVIASILASLTPDNGTLDTIVDIGAGTGGISEWLARRTSATVIAIEPETGARAAAQRLFPALRVREGSAEATGLDDGVADAAVMCGVASLIDDLAPVLVEVERIVRPGGSLAVADLFPARDDTIASERNRFRSFEELTASLEDHGWSVVEIGCGHPAPGPAWSAGARLVDAWIHRTQHLHPAYPAWCADRRHLDGHIDAGDLVSGCVVARRHL